MKSVDEDARGCSRLKDAVWLRVEARVLQFFLIHTCCGDSIH